MHRPKPFFRKQRNQWEVEYEPKKRKRLCGGPKNSETEAEAWREYHRLMASLGYEVNHADITVELAADLFLDHARTTVSHGSYVQYQIKLQDFVERHGTMKVSKLRPKHVEAWVKSHDWSDSTARGAITAVKVSLTWCAKEGHVATNPIKDMKRPKMGRRTRTVSPDERKAIRDETEGPLLDYLDALTWTGARPGEIIRLEAKHIDFDQATAELTGKTTKATGDPIFLSLIPPMFELCRRLATLYPKGPLFRNSDGNPWTTNAIRCRMRRLRDKLKIKGVTAYTFRHSFATDALERGVPVADVGALMNHKDIRTTMNYNHLKERREHLGRQARKATGGDVNGEAEA